MHNMLKQTLGVKACEPLHCLRDNAYTCPDTALTGGQTRGMAKASALPLWLKPVRWCCDTLLKAGSETLLILT